MNLLDATLFGFTAWRVCLAGALLLSYAVYKFLWLPRSVMPDEPSEADADEIPAVAYSDAPTIRLTDTQRIDRLHRIVSLQVGQNADLNDLTFGRLSRLRLEFKGIEHEAGQDFVHLQVDLGGPAAGCGSLVQELAENSFLVPRAAPDDQRSLILYFCGKTDAVSFLQMKVRLINAVERSAAIDVLHVRGRWAA